MNVDKFSCLSSLHSKLVSYVKTSFVHSGSAGAPGAVPKHGRTFTTTGPNRGQGILTQPGTGRIPICGSCGCQIRSVMVLICVENLCVHLH